MYLFLQFCDQMYALNGFSLNMKSAIKISRNRAICSCHNLQHVDGRNEPTLDTDAHREFKMYHKL